MKTQSIGHKVYTASNEQNTYEIDGSHHEHTSKEWELYIIEQGAFGKERVWVDTFNTKREAVSYIAKKLQK